MKGPVLEASCDSPHCKRNSPSANRPTLELFRTFSLLSKAFEFVCIEFKPDRLVVSGVNSTKSVFFMLPLHASFFNRFHWSRSRDDQLETGWCIQVPTRSFPQSFRLLGNSEGSTQRGNATPATNCCDLRFSPDESSFSINFSSASSFSRCCKIFFQEFDAAYAIHKPADRYQFRCQATGKQWNGWLSNLPSTRRGSVKLSFTANSLEIELLPVPGEKGVEGTGTKVTVKRQQFYFFCEIPVATTPSAPGYTWCIPLGEWRTAISLCMAFDATFEVCFDSLPTQSNDKSPILCRFLLPDSSAGSEQVQFVFAATVPGEEAAAKWHYSQHSSVPTGLAQSVFAENADGQSFFAKDSQPVVMAADSQSDAISSSGSDREYVPATPPRPKKAAYY